MGDIMDKNICTNVEKADVSVGENISGMVIGGKYVYK